MATKSPSRAIKLFGTTVVDSKGRVLRAGPLSAVLDNGQLRYTAVTAEVEPHEVGQAGEAIEIELDMNKAVLIDPTTNKVI